MRRIDELIMMASTETDDCIAWNYAKTKDGYGQVRYKGETIRAHKVSYCISNGINYDDVRGVVMHSCDNPCCINPRHLSLGTQHENIIDCVSKGRFRSVEGIKNPRSVVSQSDADKMRSMRELGMTYGDIAKNMGVGKSTAYRVITTGYLS